MMETFIADDEISANIYGKKLVICCQLLHNQLEQHWSTVNHLIFLSQLNPILQQVDAFLEIHTICEARIWSIKYCCGPIYLCSFCIYSPTWYALSWLEKRFSVVKEILTRFPTESLLSAEILYCCNSLKTLKPSFYTSRRKRPADSRTSPTKINTLIIHCSLSG